MLSQIDLKGKPIEEALEQIVIQAYDQKFLSAEQHWIVVGYSPMTNKTLEQMPKELNENQIISWVTEIGEKKGLTPQVAVFSLTSQDRELAQKGDLTLGEYALWQTADKAGVVTQPEKLKDTSERVRLLENPQVQVQIKAERNERQSVLLQSSANWKHDLGSIGKLGEGGTGKLLSEGKLVSPLKDLYPLSDKSKNKDGDKQKEQDIDKFKQMDQDIDNISNGDKQKAKGQEKYLNKDLNKAKNSKEKETQRTKYDKIYIPPIPTPGNLRLVTFRNYKFLKYDWDNNKNVDP